MRQDVHSHVVKTTTCRRIIRATRNPSDRRNPTARSSWQSYSHYNSLSSKLCSVPKDETDASLWHPRRKFRVSHLMRSHRLPSDSAGFWRHPEVTQKYTCVSRVLRYLLTLDTLENDKCWSIVSVIWSSFHRVIRTLSLSHLGLKYLGTPHPDSRRCFISLRQTFCDTLDQ